MKDLSFRLLRADEIECRPATVTAKGLSLLLYKDARCDMNILDETVGPMRWERSHHMIGDNLYCTVAIALDPDEDGFTQWVTKEDVGTQSNMEAEKGQASDSFKRACFNWGIGRELYTAPYIWIPASKCNIEDGKNGNKICKDPFIVERIEYEDRKISFLTILNDKRHEVVWSFGDPAEEIQHDENDPISEGQIITLESCIPKHGQSIENVCDAYNVDHLSDLTIGQFEHLMNRMGEK